MVRQAAPYTLMLIIPIRTESDTRHTPHMNVALIAANMLLFLLFDRRFTGPELAGFKEQYLIFQSIEPSLYQFFTYQFLHADAAHLLGNLLFLWVFGNSVNGKMGNIPYLMFYLAGGVFAAWGHAVMQREAFQLLGASGAIAAITTAYLALFPRSRVTVMVWVFFFVHFFAWPAMVLIGLKIIVWDNLVAPGISGARGVAHYAHLAGYLFGFAGALIMLWVRAVPRDQFDILALWRRWFLRRELRTTLAQPGAAAQAQYGAVARSSPVSSQDRADEEKCLEGSASLRTQISESLAREDTEQAVVLYEQLTAADPRQFLPERQQLTLARAFYGANRFEQAAATFDRFVERYPYSPEVTNVRLLLGIIYARDLRQYESADKHLTQSLEKLKDDQRRDQCRRWLRDVRAALGRNLPETGNG